MLTANAAISSRPETSMSKPEISASASRSETALRRASRPSGGGQSEIASMGGRLSLRRDRLGDPGAEMFDQFVEEIGGGAILAAHDGVGGFEVGMSRDVGVIGLLIFLAQDQMCREKLFEQLFGFRVMCLL